MLIFLIISTSGCEQKSNISEKNRFLKPYGEILIPSNKIDTVLISINSRNNSTPIIEKLKALCNEIKNIDKRQILMFNDKEYLKNNL